MQHLPLPGGAGPGAKQEVLEGGTLHSQGHQNFLPISQGTMGEGLGGEERAESGAFWAVP